MWKFLYFNGLRISLCLCLSGFVFEDNKTSKRWVNDNGEITYRLPRWYEYIGYDVHIKCYIKTNKTKHFVFRWFDEVCTENNEVNKTAESKRLEREC